MPTQKKIEAVEELQERIAKCTIAVGADYRGLSVAGITALRKQLRQAGIELRVVKNRLLARAAEGAGQPRLAELAEGPTAIAFGFGDIVTPAKLISDYVRTAKDAFAPRKIYLEGQVLPASQLTELANLPPREVLVARLAGSLKSPLARLSGLLQNLMVPSSGRLLNDSVWTFGSLLEARARQLEG